ncbi:MAG: glycosyltransferase [Myxococcota bacterium]|nr:glycosyltransferase [Myxococcota bacterium]
MRIGVVTTSYPRWPGDPAGSFVEGHVRALQRLGHQVEVIAAGDDAPRVELRERARRDRERRDRESVEHELDLRERERRAGERRTPARVTRVPGRNLFYGGGAPDALEREPLRSLLGAAIFMPRFVATVALRARRWDHVIAHWLPSAIAALAARKPLTAIAHGGDVHTLRRMHLLQPALRALRDARLVFVSDELRALAGVDGRVQPMGIDLAHFRALGRAPASPPIVLVAARLVPIKGVDIAIEAAARLPHLRLVVAGDGPERRALEARAAANTMRGAQPVTFLGHVDTARRDELLREASVVVVPSRTMPNGRREGCPTISLEALAAGVPVVATTGRATEFVDADDPTALAYAIERALVGRQITYDLVADLDWIDVASRLLSNE